MPRRRHLQPCVEPGCPELTTGQRCATHAPGPWAGSTRASRLPSDWKKRKAAVLKRDQHICYVCGKPGADQVDHVLRGDDHSLTNLAAIHARPCHRDKTQREAAAARWRHRKQRPDEPHPGLT